MTPHEQINVLVVDDDPMVTEMMVGRLDGTQYKVIGRAANGRQAVEMVKALKPDVVLMDIEMPEMNGIEASRLITDTCPTPIVVLTAYQHQKIVEEAGEAGAGAYLTKPPLLTEIERAITIAIARFKDMQKLRSLNLTLEESNHKLQRALDDVEILSGLLPICSSCKKIRDDKGYWNQLEVYIEKHSEVLFSHGICPDCAEKLYGDAEWFQKYKRENPIRSSVYDFRIIITPSQRQQRPLSVTMNLAEETKIGHRVKAVLFDFDGTLTLPGALDFAAIKRSIDCPPEMAILEYIDTITDPARKAEVNMILDKAEEEAASESIPNEGAEELLLWLKAYGILIGVITRNAMTPVIRSLENFNRLSIDDFDVVITREEPIQPKPNPESVLLAMERLNIDKNETLMVGDYLFDMTAGNEAGVTTVLIPVPGEQRDISNWGQDLTISRLLELRNLIDFYLPLTGGKLPNRFLDSFLTSLEIEDPSILISPGVGEDTTAIDIKRNEVLILKSDPVTFVSDAAAYYAVTVNANDIATSGAVPRWFLSTLLFPPGSTPSAILTVMSEVRDCCRQMGITLCGGHTEITDAVTRPVITGMVAGTVNRDSLIDKKNLSEGDQVLMTKALSIEGTSILAREFEQQLLKNGLTRNEINAGKQFLEQISIIPEAALASADHGVTAMHDITEGGLATALEELSQAGNQRIAVDMDRIPIHDLTRRMCAVFGLDPLGLIGSGSLLISCGTEHVDRLIRDLENAGIQVTRIGKALSSGHGIRAESSGREVEWPSFEADELSRLYQSASLQEPE